MHVGKSMSISRQLGGNTGSFSHSIHTEVYTSLALHPIVNTKNMMIMNYCGVTYSAFLHCLCPVAAVCCPERRLRYSDHPGRS